MDTAPRDAEYLTSDARGDDDHLLRGRHPSARASLQGAKRAVRVVVRGPETGRRRREQRLDRLQRRRGLVGPYEAKAAKNPPSDTAFEEHPASSRSAVPRRPSAER